MPKARVERVLSDDGNVKTVEVEVGERGVTKTATYSVPSTAAKWQEVILGLSDKAVDGSESPLSEAYRLFCSAVDKRARAAVYESLAQESTFITVGKEKVDIMTFPVPRLVKAINGMRSQIEVRAMAGGGSPEATEAAERSVGFGPWRTAAKRLVELGKAHENAASGMLESIAS